METSGDIIHSTYRDGSIDFLRTLGLCLVTLVHVNPPYPIRLLVYFGVPLMVFVSGLCVKPFTTTSLLKSFVHRINRLLIPVWIFQTFYWIVFYKLETPSFYSIVQSYALLGVTPYTWIIRVFIILACLSPFLVYVNQRCKHMMLLIMMLIVLQEVFYHIYTNYSVLHLPIVKIIVRDYLLYVIPYSLIFVVAIFLRRVDRSVQIRMLLCTFVLLVIASILFLVTTNDWHSSYWLALYKFPPRYLYTLYGLFCVQLMYFFKNSYIIVGNFSFIRWISKNSLWIYLYHIPFVNYLPFDVFSILSLQGAFILRWIIVILLACICVILQNRIIDTITTSIKEYKNLKK